MDNARSMRERPPMELVVWLKAGVYVLDGCRNEPTAEVATAIAWWREGLDLHKKCCKCGLTLEVIVARDIYHLSLLLVTLFETKAKECLIMKGAHEPRTTKHHA